MARLGSAASDLDIAAGGVLRRKTDDSGFESYVDNPGYGMNGGKIGMHRWRTSTRTMKHIFCFGDSVTQGNGVDSKTVSWVDNFRNILRNEFNEEIHEGYQPIFLLNQSVRYTSSGGWSNVGQTAGNLGPHNNTQSAIRSTNNTLRTITWTRPSTVNVTSCDFYWVDDSTVTSGANWSYSTDGGSNWTSVSTTSPGTATLKKTSVTGLSNPTDIRFRNANAAGTTYTNSPVFLGIAVYNGTQGWTVHNIGESGSQVACDTNGFVYASRLGDWKPLFTDLQPELIVFEFSNDATNYVQATFDTGMDTFINQVSSYADLVAYGFPDQVRLSGTSNLPLVRAEMIAKILAANGVSIDFGARWGTTTAAQALGYMPAGTFPVHPTATGDLDVASSIMRLLRRNA